MKYRLLDFAYAAEPLRDRVPDGPMALAPNTMPEPDLKSAARHNVVFAGGMMSGMMGGRLVGMRELMQSGMTWTVNGVAASMRNLDPFLTLARGQTYVPTLRNETAWHHPIHLRGDAH